jgi:thymidylate kinase
VFIEFAGTPRAGKTTVLTHVRDTLSRHGMNVRVITEAAAECPIQKSPDKWSFNVWTACTALLRMLEAREEDAQVTLVDRGLFDSLCWIDWFVARGVVSQRDRRRIDDFLLSPMWRSLLGCVVVMTVSPGKALEREARLRPGRAEGKVVNDRTLRDFNLAVGRTVSRYGGQVRLMTIDTTDLCKEAVLRMVEDGLAGITDLQLAHLRRSPQTEPATCNYWLCQQYDLAQLPGEAVVEIAAERALLDVD